MKSKEEIEKYLGLKIVSSNEEQVRDSGFAMSPDLDRYVSKYQQYYTVTVKGLSKESEKALKDLLKESMTKGDLETASTCHSILMEESSYYKAHPNAIGLDFEQGAILSEYEEQQKAIEEVFNYKSYVSYIYCNFFFNIKVSKNKLKRIKKQDCFDLVRLSKKWAIFSLYF